MSIQRVEEGTHPCDRAVGYCQRRRVALNRPLEISAREKVIRVILERLPARMHLQRKRVGCRPIAVAHSRPHVRCCWRRLHLLDLIVLAIFCLMMVCSWTHGRQVSSWSLACHGAMATSGTAAIARLRGKKLPLEESPLRAGRYVQANATPGSNNLPPPLSTLFCLVPHQHFFVEGSGSMARFFPANWEAHRCRVFRDLK